MARDLGLLMDTAVELKELRRPTSGEFSLSQSSPCSNWQMHTGFGMIKEMKQQ